MVLYQNVARRRKTFLAAITLSIAADAGRSVGVLLWVFDASKTTSGVALVRLADSAPLIIFGFFLGVFIDRWPRRAVLVTTECSRAGLTAGISLACLAGEANVVLILLGFSAVLGLTFVIAARAYLPELKGEKSYESNSTAWTIGEQVALVCGAGVAPVIYAALGIVWLLIGCAALLGLSSVLMAAAVRSGVETSSAAEKVGQSVEASAIAALRSEFFIVFADMRSGFVYIASRPPLRVGLFVLILFTASGGINAAVIVPFLVNELREPSSAVAWVGAANGIVQAFVGLALLVRFQKIGDLRLLRIGYLLMSAGAVVIAGSSMLWVLVVGIVLVSVGNTPMAVGNNALQQRLVDGDFMGRIRSVDEVAATIGFLSGAAVAGVIGDTVGPRPLLIASGALVVAAGTLVRTVLPRSLRSVTSEPASAGSGSP